MKCKVNQATSSSCYYLHVPSHKGTCERLLSWQGHWHIHALDNAQAVAMAKKYSVGRQVSIAVIHLETGKQVALINHQGQALTNRLQLV